MFFHTSNSRQHYAPMFRLEGILLYDLQESKGVVRYVFACLLRFRGVLNDKVLIKALFS